MVLVQTKRTVKSQSHLGDLKHMILTEPQFPLFVIDPAQRRLLGPNEVSISVVSSNPQKTFISWGNIYFCELSSCVKQLIQKGTHHNDCFFFTEYKCSVEMVSTTFFSLISCSSRLCLTWIIRTCPFCGVSSLRIVLSCYVTCLLHVLLLELHKRNRTSP